MSMFILKPFILLNLFILGTCAYCQQIARIENIKINSKELNQQREVLIYTPVSYDEELLTHYDVMYVFDSQNREIFDLTHALISFVSDTDKPYIVVGIVSPYIEELNYARNNDLLPNPVNVEPKDFYNGHFGGADNLVRFMKNELMPYIENNYRTKDKNVAIGHSLSASFIIYSFLKEPDMFDDYIAVSPNFAYDKERLANEFVNFDFQKVKSDKYFYFSNADEGITYWKEWKPAYEKVYTFLRSGKLPAEITYTIKEFPNEGHWAVFPLALMDGLKKNLNESPVHFSTDSYPVHITVTVPNKNDDVYIVGNQSSLGDWQVDKIRLNTVSDFEREITLDVKMPTEFKFTRGSWDSEALVKYNAGTENIWINPQKDKNFKFEILNWIDRE